MQPKLEKLKPSYSYTIKTSVRICVAHLVFPFVRFKPWKIVRQWVCCRRGWRSRGLDYRSVLTHLHSQMKSIRCKFLFFFFLFSSLSLQNWKLSAHSQCWASYSEGFLVPQIFKCVCSLRVEEDWIIYIYKNNIYKDFSFIVVQFFIIVQTIFAMNTIISFEVKKNSLNTFWEEKNKNINCLFLLICCLLKRLLGFRKRPLCHK